MIFYFTGTGNSLQVAKNIAKHHEERLESIATLMHKGKEVYEYTLQPNEKIGFVFPVYAWGPPKMVLDFIGRLKLKYYKGNYIFAIATCGENIGNTMGILDKHLKKRNINLDSGFSVVMPNNYMMMGMDVDPMEVAEKKLLKTEETLKAINRVIEIKEKEVFQLAKGNIFNILASAAHPLFIRFSSNTKKFYAKDNCIACGICEKVCTTKTIKVEDKPIWGGSCSQCLACINTCPTKAIEYGKGTIKRGRYKNPNINIEELEVR